MYRLSEDQFKYLEVTIPRSCLWLRAEPQNNNGESVVDIVSHSELVAQAYRDKETGEYVIQRLTGISLSGRRKAEKFMSPFPRLNPSA